jgi:hypothetical protein
MEISHVIDEIFKKRQEKISRAESQAKNIVPNESN